ncbi:hypothetical protein JR316_0007958 [Psilocybe cubensis]|uniref:Uncharacterized protein n=2 Tax=Psilocybe cubensis TaxID=181762 RepID=A0A8H7XVG0_PSICU|nr:hypothetical protein JR316_0007958 [Psilocybe cubensis]KAH9479368.1 hypothetical protein JR316_0007958 [Psilocybe cubensis]
MSSSRTQKSQERLGGRGLPHQSSRHNLSASGPATVSTLKIEAALRNHYKKNLRNEHLMKDLESRLIEDLSNFRAVDNLINEVYTDLQRTQLRAQTSLTQQVPQIKKELENAMDTLTDLGETLPIIDAEVSDIREVYDSGRVKAQTLVADLTWLNTEFYERWRSIIFTSSSPVSWRWKLYLRTLFVFSFVVCSWLFYISLTGAYRAHRHRLVWGEKLMS